MPMDGKVLPGSAMLSLTRAQALQERLTAGATRLQNHVAGPGVAKGTDKAGNAAKPAEAEKAATDFEALLLHQMLQSMWSTVPSQGMLGGSKEEDLYRDMFNEALSKQVAEGQSIGIKDVILKDFKKYEKK